MRDYVILSDSCCDLPAALADEMGVIVLPMSVVIGGKQYNYYLDGREITNDAFYDLIREGKLGTTSAINIEQFELAMEPLLQEGKDVLYISFSSGLSSTYNSSVIAAQELMEKYPEAKIYPVDSLTVSMAEGLMVYLAVQEKRKGKTIEEVRDYLEEICLHIGAWFTVYDLNHLKRGGRVSATTAFVGTALNIKPIIEVDNAGHLILAGKAKGRKNSIKYIVDKLKETGLNLSENVVFISHSSCPEEAQAMSEQVKRELGVKETIVSEIGPVIGAHTGVGTMALFFQATHR